MARSKKEEAMVKNVKDAAEIEADKLFAELIESEPSLRAAHEAIQRGDFAEDDLAHNMLKNFRQRLKT